MAETSTAIGGKRGWLRRDATSELIGIENRLLRNTGSAMQLRGYEALERSEKVDEEISARTDIAGRLRQLVGGDGLDSLQRYFGLWGRSRPTAISKLYGIEFKDVEGVQRGLGVLYWAYSAPELTGMGASNSAIMFAAMPRKLIDDELRKGHANALSVLNRIIERNDAILGSLGKRTDGKRPGGGWLELHA